MINGKRIDLPDDYVWFNRKQKRAWQSKNKVRFSDDQWEYSYR